MIELQVLEESLGCYFLCESGAREDEVVTAPELTTSVRSFWRLDTLTTRSPPLVAGSSPRISSSRVTASRKLFSAIVLFTSFSPSDRTGGATSTVNGATVSPTPRPYYDGGYSTSTHTLADVAYYFWSTDLRPAGTLGALGTDVSNNNVAPTPTDPA